MVAILSGIDFVKPAWCSSTPCLTFAARARCHPQWHFHVWFGVLPQPFLTETLCSKIVSSHYGGGSGVQENCCLLLRETLAGLRLKPKLHALAHMALEIHKGLKTKTPRLLNVLIWACEMNEDHIGHVARLSRKLATRTLGQRLAQRYLLKSKALFRRHLEKRKKK